MPGSSVVAFPSAGPGTPLLRGRLRLPAPGMPARGAAILCHPHPAFGGNMDVWLLPAIGRRLAADGWAVLRFDFRGCGGSEGRSGTGAHEVGDTEGALDFVEEHDIPDRRALIGWSFGALVALHAALDRPDVGDWVGIAPPTRALDEVDMIRVPTERIAGHRGLRTVIVGEHDQFYPPSDAALLAPHLVHVLPGADHFLFDRDSEVAELVAAALR